MIPYELFMFKIKYGQESVEVRALEPVDSGFRFRLSTKRKDSLNKWLSNGSVFSKEISFTASFFYADECLYTEYELEGNIIPDGEEYIFITNNHRFKNDFQKLLSDYMNMIRIKTSYDDMEAMEYLSDIHLSDSYISGINEWRTKFCAPSESSSNKLGSTELAVSIDDNRLCDIFLSSSLEDFLQKYYEENCLSGFAITDNAVTHIYLGNQFCPVLFSYDKIWQLLEQVYKYELVPVLVFAPIPQYMFADYQELIDRITEYCSSQDRCIELVVNDYGICEFIKEKGAINQEYLNRLSLTAGLLLNKRKKDPRIWQCKSSENVRLSNSSNMFGDQLVTKYLHDELNISAVSYDACGYRLDLGPLPSILHMPLYQTNTSGCIMNGIYQYGDRGMRGNLKDCPRYCDNRFVLYPDNIALIGMWNSVFSISDFEINDIPYLNGLIKHGLKRIVLR